MSMKPGERKRIQLEVSNRWDAIALLRAFSDRGSFLIERGGHFEVFVRSREAEVAARLEALPRPAIDDLAVHVGDHERAA